MKETVILHAQLKTLRNTQNKWVHTSLLLWWRDEWSCQVFGVSRSEPACLLHNLPAAEGCGWWRAAGRAAAASGHGADLGVRFMMSRGIKQIYVGLITLSPWVTARWWWSRPPKASQASQLVNEGADQSASSRRQMHKEALCEFKQDFTKHLYH